MRIYFDIGIGLMEFTYTNWEGKTEKRRAVPLYLWIGSNEWHKERQWLMEAYDMDKKANRTFALSGFDLKEFL